MVDLQFFSFNILKMLSHYLLTCILSSEKSVVIIFVLLYIMHLFFMATLKIFLFITCLEKLDFDFFMWLVLGIP